MDKYSIPRPERESYAKHKRDVNRQIILPMVLVSLIGLGIAVFSGFAATNNNPGVSLWADISIIWLIIPMMILALVILVLTLAMVYGLKRLSKIMPYYTGLIQDYALWLSAEIKIWTEKIVQPVLTIKTWLDFFVKREE